MKPRRLSQWFVMLLIGLCLASLAGEIGLRVFIFSRARVFRIFQNPNLYADYRSDDDWWKLYVRLGGIHGPPKNPHPLLGWGPITEHFDRKTYRHRDEDKVGARRPVLLFGDSFADCLYEIPCFHAYLNSDPEFSRDHYLLNYGVAGYGVDQIHLLMKEVVGRYQNPIVIFTFMLEDLDRCVLSFKGGQKPLFELVGDDLRLSGVPISPRPYEWLEQHPISIKSYLYELLRRAPYKAWGRLIGKPWAEETKTEAKKRICTAILRATIADLRRRGVTFTVVTFHPFRGTTWRDEFVRSVFAEAGVPYKGTESIVREHVGQQDVFSLAVRTRYMTPDLDHPNGLQNQIVSEHIKQYVMSAR